MTQWNGCRIGLAAVLGLVMSAGSSLAGEEEISRDDLPKAVRKAVAEKFPKAKIRGASKEVEDGRTTYEVEMTIGGRSVDAVFNTRGKVLEIEKQIPVSKLPKKVRKELEEHFPGAKIEKAEAVLRGGHGPVVFEVDLEAVLTADGKVVRGEDDEDDDADEHEHHAAEAKKEHRGHGEASCACCAKGEGSCKECKECEECKKEHDDRDDDDDDAEKHEHHAKGEHKGHGEAHAKGHKEHADFPLSDWYIRLEHGEAHAKGHKEHGDRDNDAEKHEYHAKGDHKGHGEASCAYCAKGEGSCKECKKEHDDRDDDDDDAEKHEHHAKGEHKGHGEAHSKDHKGHGEAHAKGKKPHDDRDDDDDDDDAEEHGHHAKAGEKHEHKGHGDAKGKGEKHDDDDDDR